jgi:hypothetical protein
VITSVTRAKALSIIGPFRIVSWPRSGRNSSTTAHASSKAPEEAFVYDELQPDPAQDRS